MCKYIKVGEGNMESYIDKLQVYEKNKIAGMHPKAKFWVLMLYIISTFLIGSINVTQYDLSLLLIPWLLVLVIISAASGALIKVLKGMKVLYFLTLLIFLVQSLLINGGEFVGKLGPFSIYQQGLSTGIYLSVMVLAAGGIFVWYFQTTEIRTITRALEDSGLNHQATYVAASSLQMIEVLGKDSQTIMNAQKARGVETEGNVIVRTKAFLPTLVPLILGAITGAEERALTLEARGFTIQGEKTHILQLKNSGAETPVLAISIILTVAILIGRVMLWIM